MINSPEINELAAALSKAQKMTKPAQMNSTNPFFKSKYADLGAVIEACRDALAANGLSVVQLPYSRDGRIGVESVLLHQSGQYISTVMDIQTNEGGKSDAQAAGSIISYLRRYMLAAMVGLYADEDNDGNDSKKTSDNGHKSTEQKQEQKKPDVVTTTTGTTRPYQPEKVKEGIEAKAAKYPQFIPNEKQLNLLRHGLELLFVTEEAIEDKRHTVLFYLTGHKSTKDLQNGGMFKAIVEDWLKLTKGSDGEYTVDSMASREAHLIYVQHLENEGQAQLGI